MSSKFATPSRWIAAAILAGWGLCELFLPGIEPGKVDRVIGAMFFIVPAIGIVLLHRWAYGVAVAACAFNAAQAVIGPFGPPSKNGKVTMAVTLALVLFWLFQPSVRKQFLGEDARI